MRRTWPLYVIVRDDLANREAMETRGCKPVRTFTDGTVPRRQLYRLPQPLTPDTQP